MAVGATLLGHPYFHRKHLSAVGGGFKRILFPSANLGPRLGQTEVDLPRPPAPAAPLGRSEAALLVSGHGLLPRESPVVERVHVNDLLGLDDDGRLRLLFEAPLTLERHAQLIHHGAAERSLQRTEGVLVGGGVIG